MTRLQALADYLRQLAILSRKEFLVFLRDPVLVVFLIYAFTLSVVAASAVINTDLRNAPTVFIDHDGTYSSRELIHRFREPYFQLRGALRSDRELLRHLDGGQAMVGLDIPQGFQDALRQRRPAQVQMLVDATHSHVAFLSAIYGDQIVRGLSQDLLDQQAPDMVPAVELRQRYWFNPNLRDMPFRAVEQIARMTLLFSILLPATAMARERERGTVEQLLVSPLTPLQIMLSKVLPMTCIVVVATAVALLGVVGGALGIVLRGNVLVYLLVHAMFAMTAAGIGLLIASFTRNLAQVGFLSLLVMPPMNLFAGTITPIESMPWALRPLMYLSPMYQHVTLSLGLLLEGASLLDMWDSVLTLFAVGVAVFAVGAWRFRRQLG